MSPTTNELKYAAYAHRINLESFYEAIGWAPERQGVNKKGEPEDIGTCPDPWNLHKHGDTTGKFAVNPEERVYNCWVCGGGTLLSLTMAIRGITEQEAEDWLYQFTAPVDVSDAAFASEIQAILYREKVVKAPLPWFNERVIEPFERNLPQIDSWLTNRGISMEAASKARLGFDPTSQRMPPLKTGTARREPYVGPSVLFPHFWGERLVGWQQRWLDEDRPGWIQKYTNTTGFPKTETIYNYESVYLAERPVIVCESVPTVLFLATLGYPAVATFGGSVSEEQMRLLRRFTQGVVLAPDNDPPGYKWLTFTEEERRRRNYDRVVLGTYLERFIPVKVIEPVGDRDSGNDLADLLDEGPRFAAEAVKMLYEEAEYY